MPRAPYKYLDYYTFDDADLFFGREEETQKMVGEILSTRLLVLFSPSGSGKTSLINAGVRPVLEKLGYKTIYVRLENDPIPSVQNAVAAALALSTNNKESHSERNEESLSISQVAASKEISLPISRDRNDIDDNIQNDNLHSFLKNAAIQAGKPLVIFIDQFEEFFIVFEHKQEARRKFIEQVAKIKYDDGLPVFLVLSLREDYFANLHEFREAIPSIFQNNANIRLEDFTDDEARRAIVKPLEAVGAGIEEGLVEILLRDLKNSKPGIEPITLQIVCDSVWQKKPANAAQITNDDYNASGGAKHILTNYVSRLLNDLPLRQQGLMAKIFAELKTPDDTKRYRSFSDLRDTLKIGANRLQAALKKLADLNLLRREERAGDLWFEFKHDYLVAEITAWLDARQQRMAKRLLLYGLSQGLQFIHDLQEKQKSQEPFMEPARKLIIKEAKPAKERARWPIKFYTFPKYAYALAAAILMAISTWSTWLFIVHFTTKQYLANRGEQLDVSMSDGSKAKLNSESRLTISRNFNKKSREVTLTGEAYFDVQKGDLPFFVNTKGAVIGVTGTKFNVKARNEIIEVAVNEGVVEVSSTIASITRSIILTAGQFTSFRFGEYPTPPQQIPSELYPGWMVGKMIFYDTSLKQVIEEIERRFDVTIQLQDKILEKVTITGLFEGDELESILSAICKLTQKNYRRVKNEEYIIY